jgi:hypothetical protein
VSRLTRFRRRKSTVIKCYATLVVFFLSIFGFVEPRAQALPPPGWGTLTWYKDTTETVLNNSRRMIEPSLSGEDRKIAQSISYRVTAQPGAGAFATWEDGRRIVVISAGLIQMMEFLSEAIIFNDELGVRGCFDEYSKYLAERVISNTERHREGLGARAVVNLYGYSRRSNGPCRHAHADAFTSRPDLGEYRAKMIEASIVFFYLHELAHHLLGHTDRIRSGSDTSLAMHRDQEDSADRWAITTALKDRYNLIIAMPAFSFIALTGGDSIESEKRMDHPLGIRRFLTLYQEVGRYFRERPQEWKEPPRLIDFLKTVDETQANLESQIANLRP